MKRAILLLLVSISTIVYGQKEMYEINNADTILGMPAKNGKVNYSGVITNDSASKMDLYVMAKSYIIDSFKSGKDVIQFDDKENGILTGKGFFRTYVSYGLAAATYEFWFILKIQFKEGRAKYEITDIDVVFKSAPPYPDYTNPVESYKQDEIKKPVKKVLKTLLPAINNHCKSIETGLEKALKEKPNKSDW